MTTIQNANQLPKSWALMRGYTAKTEAEAQIIAGKQPEGRETYYLEPSHTVFCVAEKEKSDDEIYPAR